MTDETFPPILSFQEILGADNLHYGFIKCRLVHIEDKSFVLPDVLMVSCASHVFYSPNWLVWRGWIS